MKCNTIRDLFDARIDEGLTRDRAVAFDAHLSGCPTCRAEYVAHARAVRALRSRGGARTTPELRDALLAAVDSSQPELAAGVHPLRRAAGYAAATLLGAAAALWGAFTWMPREVRIVEQRVEVPVEVPVPFEVPVEVVVERQVTVPVERVLPGPPVFELRGPEVAAALGALARAFEGAADTLRVRRGPVRTDIAAGAPARTPGPRIPQSSDPARPSVTVSNVGGRVSLQARGSLDEVVPMLLETMNGADADVAAVVERRLRELRSAVARDPDLGPRLAAAEAAERPSRPWQPFGVDEEDEAADVGPTSAGEWDAWWNAHGAMIAAAAPRLEL